MRRAATLPGLPETYLTAPKSSGRLLESNQSEAIPAETLSKLGAVHGADRGQVRNWPAGVLMGDLILADFKSRTWHRQQTLEERAAVMVEQFNRMAEEGTEVVCELVPFEGNGIDGMWPNFSNDPA